MATQGPLTQMALALQARDQQFQARLTNAVAMTGANPTGALAEFGWASQEFVVLERLRQEFESAMDQARVQMGAAMAPQDAALRADMDASSHNTWLQAQCGIAQALMLLRRFPEARAVADAAFAALGPQSSRDARAMVLKIRGSISAAIAQGL